MDLNIVTDFCKYARGAVLRDRLMCKASGWPLWAGMG